MAECPDCGRDYMHSHDASGARYEVPVLDIADTGLHAEWYPRVRTLILTDDNGQEFTLHAGEVRALFRWVELHELNP